MAGSASVASEQRWWRRFMGPGPASASGTQGGPPKSHWRRALGFAFPYKKTVGVLLLLTLLLAGINAVEPLVLKFIFDNLSVTPELRPLLVGIVGLLGLGLFRELVTGISNWLTWHA